MEISSEPDEKSDTQSEWRRVWRFLDSGMGTGLSISYPSPTQIPN